MVKDEGTNPMEQCSSWEADGHSVCQEISPFMEPEGSLPYS
jgi:hypothetical protein